MRPPALLLASALLFGPAAARAADSGMAGAAAAVADAGAVAADPEAPTLTARADKAKAHVGDVITLTVTAISKVGVPVNLPNKLDLDPFTILDRKEAQQNLGDQRVKREFTLMVAAYEPGETQIPPVEVTYLGKGGDVRSAETATIPIRIASLIANEPEPAFKDAAPPVPVWQQDLLLVYIAAGLLAAGLGALITWLVVRRLRGRAMYRPGPPPRPAHEIALERLDRLGAYGFLENADNRPFYFAVSEVIRDYLGARFGFDSLELTTDELMATLRRRGARENLLGAGVLVEIDGWLSSCDLVKFAKVSPTAAESRGALETAIRIVNATRPRVEVSPPPVAAGEAPPPPREAAGG